MRQLRPFVHKKTDMYFLKKLTVILLISISILCVMLMKVHTYKIFYFVCENFSPKNLRFFPQTTAVPLKYPPRKQL